MGNMFRFIPIVFLMASCCGADSNDKKSWTFEIISITAKSEQENLVKFDLNMKRIRRGIYGLRGTVEVNANVLENDNTMIEATIERSVTGSSEYKGTPYSMKKQHFYDFLNTQYKNTLMDSLAGCSDFPVFGEKFEPPLVKKTYHLNDCMISNEGMPTVMSDGYYKIDIIGSGKVKYAVEVIAKVESTY